MSALELFSWRRSLKTKDAAAFVGITPQRFAAIARRLRLTKTDNRWSKDSIGAVWIKTKEPHHNAQYAYDCKLDEQGMRDDGLQRTSGVATDTGITERDVRFILREKLNLTPAFVEEYKIRHSMDDKDITRHYWSKEQVKQLKRTVWYKQAKTKREAAKLRDDLQRVGFVASMTWQNRQHLIRISRRGLKTLAEARAMLNAVLPLA